MPDFVKTVYQNILDRDPESQAVIYGWTNHAHSNGIAETIWGFFNSDEFKAKNSPHEIIVDKLYRSILGREAEEEGKNYWLGRIGNGDAMQTIVNDFIGSDEFRQKVQDNSVPHPVIWPNDSSHEGGFDWRVPL
jgi:hypothetical protein